MKIRKPAYFDNFRCLASACPDSCCKEWDVLVDEESAARYLSLEGTLGDALRKVMYEEDGQHYFAIQPDRRCPMWRDDGLCRIQAEAGEDALCNTCRLCASNCLIVISTFGNIGKVFGKGIVYR